MAEIGLLPFARVALKHTGAFPEAEVRLGEHRDSREVLQLPNVLMVRFGIELGIRQHQTEWRASRRSIH